MKTTHLRPMLESANLKQTIGFYSEILGFSCQEKLERDGGIY